MTLFPALAIASLVVAVNLVADGDPRGVRAMSDRRGRHRRSRSRISSSSTASAGSTGPSSAASRSRSSAGARTGSSASPAAASRPRRSAIVRYLPRNGRVTGGSITVAGRDVLGARASSELRDYHARTVSMVYQNPGAALNPGMRDRHPGRRGVHGARRAAQGSDGARPRRARRRCRSPIPRASWAATRISSPAACSSAS